MALAGQNGSLAGLAETRMDAPPKWSSRRYRGVMAACIALTLVITLAALALIGRGGP